MRYWLKSKGCIQRKREKNKREKLRNITNFNVSAERTSGAANARLPALQKISNPTWVKVWDAGDGLTISNASRLP